MKKTNRTAKSTFNRKNKEGETCPTRYCDVFQRKLFCTGKNL